jgi:hypothetical protein
MGWTKRVALSIVLAVAMVVLLQGAIHAQGLTPIWCQEQFGGCMIYSGHYDRGPTENVGDVWVIDDFLATTGDPITDIKWWGYVIISPDQPDYFIITFYAHGGCGGPGATIAQRDVYDYTWTAQWQDIWEYEASIEPVTLVQGQTYWISIRAVVTDPSSVWEWFSGNTPDGPWNCKCMVKGDYFGATGWIPIYPDLWPVPECISMSFCLYYDEAAAATDQSTWGRIKGMFR